MLVALHAQDERPGYVVVVGEELDSPPASTACQRFPIVVVVRRVLRVPEFAGLASKLGDLRRLLTVVVLMQMAAAAPAPEGQGADSLLASDPGERVGAIGLLTACSRL